MTEKLDLEAYMIEVSARMAADEYLADKDRVYAAGFRDGVKFRDDTVQEILSNYERG